MPPSPALIEPPFLSDGDIARIATGVIERTLPKAQWTHAAHFAAAIWVLTRPGMDAARDMPRLIRAYNAATDTPNTDTAGYHETITQASLRCARHWLALSPHAPLSRVLADLLASDHGRSDWLLRHWSRDVLFSVEARRRWVAPNLQPLPF